MKLVDRDHPFYQPLWRRILLVGVVAGWSTLEIFVTRDPMWIAISLGLLAICIWQFLLTFPKHNQQPPTSP